MADEEEREVASTDTEDDDNNSDSDGAVADEGENESELTSAKASREDLIHVERHETITTQNAPEKTNLKPAKPKIKRRRKRMNVNLTNCKYECVRRATKKFGFREVSDDEDFVLFWTDSSVSLERVMDMKKYQKINHFPGMSEICRKDSLARNMNRLWKQFPKEYAIFPQTWCLPADYGDFLSHSRQKKNKTYIVKPDSGSQGRGIFLTRNPKQDVKPGEDVICQQYVSKPFLIDGFKFDLRIYAVVTSCDPLRIFVFQDGLVRFATVKYADPQNSNLENVFLHLTNYSINKASEDFIRDEETGSKRRISILNKWFAENGYNLEEIWGRIDDVIIKTLITAHPILKHNYRTCFPNHNRGSGCFEILGFDILLDRKLKPWVLEVNHSPSFSTDSRLDREIKDALVYDTLRLVNFTLCDRKKCIEEEKRKVRERLLQKPKAKEQRSELDPTNANDLEALTRYEDKHIGNFRRIYPQNNCEEKYVMYFENSCSLFQETAASKARSECARIQREEIKQKGLEIEFMRKKNCGKKICIDGMRPESPRQARKRKSWRVPSKFNRQQANVEKCFDSAKPMPIDEEEELERLSGMLQRDNLVRSLGVAEQIYRLLHDSGIVSRPNNRNAKPDTQKPKEDSQSIGAQVFKPQRPLSTSNNATIRSYLGRFLSQQHASPGVGLNPIITPVAVGSERVNHSANDLNGSQNICHRNRTTTVLPFGMNYSPSLNRPKLGGGRKSSFTARNAVEQEISAISRGIELDVNRIGKQLQFNQNQNQQCRPMTHQQIAFPLSIESIEPLNQRLSYSEITSPPHGPILPSHACTNLTRYTKQDSNSSIGLSIVSTPAPVQYKDDQVNMKHNIPSDSTGSNEVNGAYSKSTRAQRVRGASNSLRLRQIELVENRAMALS
eukprot:gene9971-10994_t